MFAKKIKVEYYPNLSNDIIIWRRQGFKGEIVITWYKYL